MDVTDGRTDGQTDGRRDGVKHPSHNTLRSASALLNASERIKMAMQSRLKDRDYAKYDKISIHHLPK